MKSFKPSLICTWADSVPSTVCEMLRGLGVARSKTQFILATSPSTSVEKLHPNRTFQTKEECYTLSGRDAPRTDGRESHLERPGRSSAQVIQSVVEWVKKLPSRNSHYPKGTEEFRRHLSSDSLTAPTDVLCAVHRPLHLLRQIQRSEVRRNCKIRSGSIQVQ